MRGLCPGLASTDAALEYIMKAIEKAGYKPGEDVVLALDAAATEFHEKAFIIWPVKEKLDAGGMPIIGPRSATAFQSLQLKTAWTKMTGKAGAR